MKDNFLIKKSLKIFQNSNSPQKKIETLWYFTDIKQPSVITTTFIWEITEFRHRDWDSLPVSRSPEIQKHVEDPSSSSEDGQLTPDCSLHYQYKFYSIFKFTPYCWSGDLDTVRVSPHSKTDIYYECSFNIRYSVRL